MHTYIILGSEVKGHIALHTISAIFVTTTAITIAIIANINIYAHSMNGQVAWFTL